MDVNIYKIKRAWANGKEAGANAANFMLSPSDQDADSDMTWETIADDDYEAVSDEDSKAYPSVWKMGYLCGYYSSAESHEVLDIDRKGHGLAVHMEDRINVMG